MNALVVFISTGLLIYWLSRSMLMLQATEDQVEEVLERDFWWGYRLWLALRSMFSIPNQFAG
jgi:hypothetical protein